MRHPYLVATRFALLEHARNRFALGLLLVFVPLWFAVIGLMVPGDPVAFKLMSTGALVQVDGHRLTLITAGFNALTLIVGFMLFATTRRNARFDRRLVLAGYARPVLLLAKLTALLAVAALVALYAAAVLVFFWPSRTLPFVWLGYFGDALIYGALGVLLGALVTSELAGFFVLIMVSLMDTFLQAPVENPLANKPFLIALPTYGPMQVAVSGAFTRTLPVAALLLALAWCAGFAALGLGIFWWRTRTRAIRTAPLEHRATALASLEPPPAR
ncbi:MAG TPA: hypothetical protein VFW96_13580 [Thermomicrobiales bacterium]|nr:hypothetical protein [Thermomicrobiales bacterium]